MENSLFFQWETYQSQHAVQEAAKRKGEVIIIWFSVKGERNACRNSLTIRQSILLWCITPINKKNMIWCCVQSIGIYTNSKCLYISSNLTCATLLALTNMRIKSKFFIVLNLHGILTQRNLLITNLHVQKLILKQNLIVFRYAFWLILQVQWRNSFNNVRRQSNRRFH